MQKHMTSNREVAEFILGRLEDGARRSNEIRDLVAKEFGTKYDLLAEPRKLLGKRVVTGLGSSGRRPGREKYWALAEDVVIETRTITKFADD
jgi:hypothetical protein